MKVFAIELITKAVVLGEISQGKSIGGEEKRA